MRLPVSIALLLLAISTFPAQSVPTRVQNSRDRITITAKRAVLVRSGKWVDRFPERKRAIVTYPLVSGLTNPVVLRKVRSILQLKNVFDSSLTEYRDNGWLTEFGYHVNYNKNFILDLTFTQSGMGAYPDEQSRHFLITLRDGSVIRPADVFVAAKLPQLQALVNEKFQTELKEILESLKNSKSDPEDIRIASEAQETLDYKSKDLDNFEVGVKGVTFLYDAGYPYVIRAFEPQGRYFFTYSQLKPYIKRDGPLGQFVQ